MMMMQFHIQQQSMYDDISVRGILDQRLQLIFTQDNNYLIDQNG